MIEIQRDSTFKALFKEEKGILWFIDIIKKLLGIDLSEYELTSETYTTGENQKHDFYADVVMKNGGDMVIIEAQNSKTGEEKAFYYLFRIAGYNIEKNKTLGGRTTLIRFLNYYPNEKIKKEKATVIEMSLMNPEYDYSVNFIKCYDIVLPNFKKLEYNSDIEKRMKMFTSKTYEEMESYAVTDLDKWLVNKLRKLESDENFMFEYDNELMHEMLMNTERDKGWKEGLEEGRAEGREKGIQENKILVVKELNKINMPLKQIAQVTKLSNKEVKNIIRNKD